ncbi:MAG: TA system VapC family ribonuclease toxin [Gemmobacter sp.]
MTVLLDVNILIALADPLHGFHESAHVWFATNAAAGWATCPITENGFLRIVGNPRYPRTMGSPAAVRPILESLLQTDGHVFWADSISLLRSTHVDIAAIRTSAQMTDTYLLALAVTNGGRLATFDRRLSTVAVVGGAAALDVIPA